MRLWLTQLISDFCRWRAHAAYARGKRAIVRGRAWLDREEAVTRRAIMHQRARIIRNLARGANQ